MSCMHLVLFMKIFTTYCGSKYMYITRIPSCFSFPRRWSRKDVKRGLPLFVSHVSKAVFSVFISKMEVIWIKTL